ncbi:MAG: toprim domain-containing protein, partial [Planctomycetota bacterium]|nr:toprim domain-containing protein [Planctomycetota bacterium]
KASVDSILDHEEIQTIVSAVGTGFLTDEFEPERLRYGKIIIMTDADVDGSHIRTLLLTLFYRKMPELVNHGHVFVAQPPLYLVKKGKTERYAVTEEEKIEIMGELGLGKTALKHGDTVFEHDSLRRLIEVVGRIMAFEARMPGDAAVPYIDYLSEATVPDCQLPTHYIVENGAGRFVDTEAQMQAELENMAKGLGHELRVYEGPESQCARDEADVEVHALLVGPEVQGLLKKLLEMGISASNLGDATGDENGSAWEVVTGENADPQPSLTAAVNTIQQNCEKELHIQRYKGLGEMNPSQLFESTMDPARRLLSRVAVSDMVEADRIFTVLMGPEVEPRRDFIEKHSLEATNLDF